MALYAIVAEVIDKDRLQIYPNPATHEVRINFNKRALKSTGFFVAVIHEVSYSFFR